MTKLQPVKAKSVAFFVKIKQVHAKAMSKIRRFTGYLTQEIFKVRNGTLNANIYSQFPFGSA